MKKHFDSLGRGQDRGSYNPDNRLPYIVDQSTTGTTYLCYESDPKVAVYRVVESGNITTMTIAFGAWDNRANLDYVPVNDLLEVD